VQTVYGDDPLPECVPQDARSFIEQSALGKHMANLQVERQMANNVSIDPFDEPQNAYLNKPRGSEDGDGLGIKNRTRLGDDGVTVVPVHLVEGGWCVFAGNDPFDSQQPASDDVAKGLFARQMSLSRKDIVKHMVALEAPPSFTEHPLLRSLKPLVFESGNCVIGSLRLHLDANLGLVYEKAVNGSWSTGVPSEENA
jgi:CRISPR-associated endonuclease/helicase Cas3